MKIGFIGAGNMANALLTGVKNNNKIDKKDIYVTDTDKSKLDYITKNYGFNVLSSNEEVFKTCEDIVFLCIKPQVFDEIKDELKKMVNKNQIIVSIMAGKAIDYLSESLGTKNVVRVMPNTPCLAGAGICAIAANDEIKKDGRFDTIVSILKGAGEAEVVDEKYINAITQVSGASPAWVFMMIEALADGGVECGMPRDMAYKFATNAVYGSGKLAVDKYNENKTHPGVLKDMVTSPAGTTIEGVRVLEENGFRGAVIDAVLQSYSRSLEL